MGRNLFRARCTSCHGLDAKGGEEGDGPDLTTGRFRNATTDAGLFRVIHDGIEGTSMRGLRREDEQSIWQLVTYLRSLAPVAAADLPGSPVAGARLFEAQECSSCHRVAGRGGRLGPDLSTVAARRRPDEMRLALVDPGAE
ncbi:MAG: c-type cytochrome, partial [Thermoanaerobaculia bacterium]|nr:c-type cytochrome [Thermoanaerobaculia bacterium]